jgi:nucleotide-binding universal stress UspA family protein
MMPRFERILCPVDFSPCSQTALEYALYMAEQFQGKVHVLHVCTTPVSLYPELVVWAEREQSTLGALIEEQAREQMGRLIDGLNEHQRSRVIPEVEMGDPVSTIIERAERAGCDLIVVGTHGRTGLAHLVLGSVAERVVRGASCAVLTVRPPSAPRVLRKPAALRAARG